MQKCISKFGYRAIEEVKFIIHKDFIARLKCKNEHNFEWIEILNNGT